MSSTVRDAYISVEIADHNLESLRGGLKELLNETGVDCELASSAAHVSIAYGEGDIALDALDRVSSEIAALPFQVRVSGFDVLTGETTPFDYLVVNLEAEGSFGAAVEAAQGCMKTKNFAGGFRSHISLLKFAKGALSRADADQIVGEMNTIHAVARVLGRPLVCLKGAHVSVFGADRSCRLSKSFCAA